MKFKMDEIARATNGTVIGGRGEHLCVGIGIDSRKANCSELFVAIKGAHFDGHDFIPSAIEMGVSSFLVKRGFPAPKGCHVVEVEDTEKALGDIALWWRSKFLIPVIAITGSNGKSTTKEMAFSILSTLGDVLKTEGNFNNLIGLPLTVFRLGGSHVAAILEMGMNAPGEIARLADIARPGIGLITNVTAAHLAKLHSVDAVAHAKGELFEKMGNEGTIIVNNEDPWVRKLAEGHRGPRITFGMRNNSDVRFLSMDTDGLDSMELSISVMGKELKLALPVPGTHNLMNAMAAISVGIALGVDPEEATHRLSNFTPMAMRFEQVQLANGVRVVNDSYNANPESMRAAFRTVGSAKRTGKFIAVLGDMLELGSESESLHEQLGSDAVRLGVDMIYVVGNFSSAIKAGASEAGMSQSDITVFDDIGKIAGDLEDILKAGDVVLVKGSRGMKMEKVVESLKHSIGMG